MSGPSFTPRHCTKLKALHKAHGTAQSSWHCTKLTAPHKAHGTAQYNTSHKTQLRVKPGTFWIKFKMNRRDSSIRCVCLCTCVCLENILPSELTYVKQMAFNNVPHRCFCFPSFLVVLCLETSIIDSVKSVWAARWKGELTCYGSASFLHLSPPAS